MSLIIRPMTSDDLDVIMDIARETAESLRWMRADYEAILTPDHGALLQRGALVARTVARNVAATAEMTGETRAGFVVYSILAPEKLAELELIAVDLRNRRQGLGTALLQAAMTAAALAGATKMHLELRQSNSVALGLYLKQNFRVTGRRRDYYQSPVEDAVLLEALLIANHQNDPA